MILITTRRRNNEEEIKKIETFDLNSFLDKTFFSDDSFQSIFVYQPTLYTLELKESDCTKYVIGCKIEMQLNKSVIIVEQNITQRKL